ncbi:MAG: hypothetical protein NMNS02_01430 [Nitrosomonas sp.]|nr:MAG: hypothetical protein NMNS02_01430 [Nitrosomonas sp.]
MVSSAKKLEIKENLIKAALKGNEKALRLLFELELLSEDEFKKRKSIFDCYQKYIKKQHFLFGAFTGVATFFLTKILIGESVSGTGITGLLVVAIIVIILTIIKTS